MNGKTLYCLAVLGIVGLCLIGCRRPQPPLHDRATSTTELAPGPHAAANLADLSPGPVLLFEESCARCHGPQGSFYGQEFAKLDDAHLRQAVTDMMRGPAGLDPSLADIAAMVAYHRALRETGLFVVATNAGRFAGGKDRSLQGEVTPGAAVEIHKDRDVVPAQVQDMTWTVANPPAMPFSVVAKDGGKRVQFPFPRRQWNGG